MSVTDKVVTAFWQACTKQARVVAKSKRPATLEGSIHRAGLEAAIAAARPEIEGPWRTAQAIDSEVIGEATRLLEYALHLRMRGENASGGTETWAQFDRDCEHFLRATGSRPSEQGGQISS